MQISSMAATDVPVAVKEQTAVTQRIGTGLVLGLGTALLAGYLMAGFTSFTEQAPASATGYLPQALQRENVELPPRFIRSWGIQGSGEGQFHFVFHLDTDADGNIYTVERLNHRVQKFARNGTFLATWGSSGSGEGQFNNPTGIGVDAKNQYVYVADTSNNRIQKFTLDGQFKTGWGMAGAGDGQFNSPYAVGVDANGNVYVADSGNNRIQKFSPEGQYLTQWNENGLGGAMSFPLDVEGTADGVYVIDAMNRVEKFTFDGTFLTGWGGYGSGEGQFFNPTGISIDRNGNVYVADEGNDRIQKFTATGVFLSQWDRGDQEFVTTEDIAVDAQMIVSVTDFNRIQQFGYVVVTPAQ